MRFERARLWLTSFRFQTTAWTTLVVSICLLFVLIIVSEIARSILIDEFDKALLEETRDLAALTTQVYGSHDFRLNAAVTKFLQNHAEEETYFDIVGPRGRPYRSSPNIPIQFSAQRHQGTETIKYDHEGYRVVQICVETRSHQHFCVRGLRPRTALNDYMRRLNQTMFVAGLIAFVVAPVGGYFLAGRAIQPVAALTATANRLQPQNLNERLPVRSKGDELDRLSQTINGMLDRVATYIRHQREFVGNAAHELRSPLTSIRTSVEVALTRPRSAEEYEAVLGDVAEECTQLANLISRMLVLAEGDAGRLAVNAHPVRFDEIVAQSVSMFSPVAEIREIQLLVEANEAAWVHGDDHFLIRVVRNLLDNAIKFSNPNGKILVRSKVADGKVRLEVQDFGEGISPEDQSRVFERFYRTDPSRNRESHRAGHGLGLSICDEIVKSLGGEISVTSQLGQGSTFVVILPTCVPPPVCDTQVSTHIRRANEAAS